MKIAYEIGNRRGEKNALGNLGNAYAALGEPRPAIELYGQALQIAQEIGDRGGKAFTNWNLGILYRKEGDLDKAISSMQKRVDYERKIGYSDAEKHASIVADLKPQKKII